MKKTIPLFLVFCLLFLTACNTSENLTLDLSDHTLENAKTEEEGYIFPGLSWSSTTDEVVALFDLPEVSRSKKEATIGIDLDGDGKVYQTQYSTPVELFGYTGMLTFTFLEDILYKARYEIETDDLDAVMETFSAPLLEAFGETEYLNHDVDGIPQLYVWASPGGGYEKTQLYLWRDIDRKDNTVALSWARTHN